MGKLLITIDGPAGAGKTTVSRALADRLGYRYIDTGMLYRGVAYEVKLQNVNTQDEDDLKKLCERLQLRLVHDSKGLHLISNGTDITDQIRTPEITMLASAVSARPVVRQYLLDFQRNLGKEKAAVFEGRDMGTVVFPDADVKFFLDASPQTRAMRRYEEIKSITTQTVEEVEHDIKHRDRKDSTRKVAPLKPAPDAITVDSTELTIPAVVDLMVMHITEAMLTTGPK
jgi:cytidylate kinase